MSSNDFDFELLRRLAESPESSQRTLAGQLGVSVGKVNYCLRALIDKGWLKVNNFRRSDNKWAYAYLLTPRGVTAKAMLARQFLSQKEREFERLRAELDALKSQAVQEPPSPRH